MELRWMYYLLPQLPVGTGAIHLGSDGQSFAMVLQYRDGVTHDAPWIDVPITFYQPQPHSPA